MNATGVAAMTAGDFTAPPGTPPRVLHLGKYYPPARGGIETHVQALARGQAGLGATVRVLCVNHADADGADVTERPYARTRTLREHDGAVELIRLGRLANVARLDLTARLPLALREAVEEADVVHLHTPNATFLLGLAALPSLRARLVITHHSDIVRQRWLRLAVRPFEALVYGRADTIFCTTAAYAEASPVLQAHAGCVHVLPLGIDLQAWRAPAADAVTRVRRRIGAVRPLWLSVGRLVYYKGLETAVRALQHVDGRWAVVGTGPLERPLKALATALGVSDRIVWLGEVDDAELAALYAEATALWFPSNARSEAFGLVQAEAMASGCPVINCAIPGSGVSWVSSHEVSGLTVPVGDVEAFATAARQLATDEPLRARLAAGARERATDFDQVALARQSLEHYGEILRSR